MRDQRTGAPTWKACAASVALALAAATPPDAAIAQDENFYAGKTLTLIVGFSPGGGYDIYARTVARLVSSDGSRYSSSVWTRWALVEPRE